MHGVVNNFIIEYSQKLLAPIGRLSTEWMIDNWKAIIIHFHVVCDSCIHNVECYEYEHSHEIRWAGHAAPCNLVLCVMKVIFFPSRTTCTILFQFDDSTLRFKKEKEKRINLDEIIINCHHCVNRKTHKNLNLKMHYVMNGKGFYLTVKLNDCTK